jgi:hypothetical protein
MNSKFKLRLACFSSLAVVAAFAVCARGDITSGLIGHWTLDQTNGTAALDTSGEGHNGTVSNQLGDDPKWGAGKIGGALEFRGPDNGSDAVLVSGIPALTNTFSVSAWVLADPRDGTWPQSAIVCSSGLTSGGPLGLVIRLKDRDQAFGPLGNTSVDAGGPISTNETVGFPVSNWQQVGLVADGTAIHLYRNGAEVAAVNCTPPFPLAVSPEVGIGVNPDDGGAPGGGYWQGKIDDVGIWQTALTTAQMASIFNAGQAGKDLTQADSYQNLPPTITAQPTSITRFVGETANLTVQATGSGTLSYQWKLNGAPISGATSATYSIASVKVADAGQYIVVVSNTGGNTESLPATLTVKTVTIATGNIGYWKFDEQTGDVAVDTSTNRNDGVLNNYPGDNSQWVTGQIGGALSLGGGDAQQFSVMPDYPKPTSTLTVSAWVWAEELGTWASFVKNWGSSDAGQFHFGLLGDGVHENIYIKQADGKTPNTTDPQPFPTNSWQHVAFVCDGSMVRLYRNGAEVASTSYDGTLVSPPMNCIGIGVKMANDCTTADTGAAGWFHGKIDDVAIWNRGLSPSEMVAIYNAGLLGKGALEADTSLVFPPTITSQTTNATVFEGVQLTLNVAANGTPPLLYQWYKNGQAIQNATNSSLNLGLATTSMAGTYKASVSNQGGSVTSADITVAVLQRPPATLFCEWKFEDNTTDTSGNANDGTPLGTVEYVAGISGKAARLAAANPIANDAAQGLPLFGTNSWSLNLWLKLTAPPKSLSYIAGFGPTRDAGGGTARALLAFSGPQANNLYVWGSNSDTPSSTPYPLNRWAMVTVTHDGADGTTAIYLDGQLANQNVALRTDIPDGENKISLAPTSNWSVDTAGDFDEFTIWKGVLTPDQLKGLYGAGQPTLSVKLSGTSVIISWPATATGFTLESADNLTGATWNPVPGVTGNSVTLPVGTGNAYFRLRQ